MRRIPWILAAVALVGTIAPAVMYLAGLVSNNDMQRLMLAATVIWFATVPFCGRVAKSTAAQNAADDK